MLAKANAGASAPRFIVVGKRRKRLWLVCSSCERKIRRIRLDEKTDITRAYFCKQHDPGYTVKNRE